MRCRKCGQTASINMHQHRLSLCKNHYNEWFIAYTKKTIEKYHLLKNGEKALVAVSGGKDSLVLWDVLNQLGYYTEGLYINLGINEVFPYSDRSQDYAQVFADKNKLNLRIFDVRAELGRDISNLVKQSQYGKNRPCSVCGIIKRHILNSVTRQHEFQIIATGHNLDDEVAVLFSNNLNWNLEQLSRQTPLLPETSDFARKIKPLCRSYERETTAYALLNGIEYIEEECPFSIGSKTNNIKTWFNQLEKDQPGIKFAYFTRFLAQKKAGFLSGVENLPIELHQCPKCGQPTTSEEFCAFCKLLDD